MSPTEVAWRAGDQARKLLWAHDQVRAGPPRRAPGPSWFSVARRTAPRTLGGRRFSSSLPKGALESAPAASKDAILAAADAIMAGRWELLGAARTDMADPDWFLDPLSGKRAPETEYCFQIDHRREDVTGNVKQVWELSRMHHLTVLAAAYAISGDERYAERAASHLRSWWAKNPFLSGIHWTSGIELGVRLISWVWTRRLLEGWTGVQSLFETNEDALRQIWWHQRYLASFQSRGSSANNHVIAEAAGQLVASLAFDWFEESEKWASKSAKLLEAAIERNTFPSGVNREMAFEYHGLVAELGLVAGAEADRASKPLSDGTWRRLCQMVDVIAAVVDVDLRAPRYGDGDDGRALVFDPAANRWETLLSTGGAIFGAPPWWPRSRPDALSTALVALSPKHPIEERPSCRPHTFSDAGMTIMRAPQSDFPEIWCRCDAGPHGFLSIAAHAHADALSVEIRHGGVDILADPGTYCYHGEPKWRQYFRSTAGHNTLELGHQDQSTAGGPFLWARHAKTRLADVRVGPDGEVTLWAAEHDGYEPLVPPARHRRTVVLRRDERQIDITDEVGTAGAHPFRLSFHLGPTVSARLDGDVVYLEWAGPGGPGRAKAQLAREAVWRLANGAADPVLGWYSPHFGARQPSTTLVGEGICAGKTALRTVFYFDYKTD